MDGHSASTATRCQAWVTEELLPRPWWKRKRKKTWSLTCSAKQQARLWWLSWPWVEGPSEWITKIGSAIAHTGYTLKVCWCLGDPKRSSRTMVLLKTRDAWKRWLKWLQWGGFSPTITVVCCWLSLPHVYIFSTYGHLFWPIINHCSSLLNILRIQDR